MKFRLKINGVIVFVSFMVAVFFPALVFRKSSAGILDEITEVIGIAFILVGQLLRFSARGYKSEQSRNGFALVRGGPYALVRNPMYLGILLIGLGIVLVLFKWWVVIILLLMFITRYVFLIFQEEKRLLNSFSGEYQDYMRKVPRLLPSLGSLFRQDIRQYLPLKVSWLKKEIGPIFAVLFITLFAESWEDIKNEGLGVYCKEAAAIVITIVFFITVAVYLSQRNDNYRKNVSGQS